MLGRRGPRVTTETRVPRPGAAAPDPAGAPLYLRCWLRCSALPARGAYNEPLSGSSPWAARAGAQQGSSQLAPGSAIHSRQDLGATPGVGGGVARPGRGRTQVGSRNHTDRSPPSLPASPGVWMIKPAGRATAGPTNGPKNLSPEGRSFWEDKRPLCRKLDLYLAPSSAGGIFATIQIDTLMPGGPGCLLGNREVRRDREARWLLEQEPQLPSPPGTSLYPDVPA